MDSSQINIILIDFDGVLTDGKLNLCSNGTEFRGVHNRDVRAIRELIARGYEVWIITASKSNIIEDYSKRVGCGLIVSRDKKDLHFTNYIAVGDDVWDIEMLKKAERAYCPADADTSVRSLPNVIELTIDGGKGVIAELVRLL